MLRLTSQKSFTLFNAHLTIILVYCVQLFTSWFTIWSMADLRSWVHFRFEYAVWTFVGVDWIVIRDVPSHFIVEHRSRNWLSLIEAFIHHNGFPLKRLPNKLCDGLGSSQGVFLHKQFLSLYSIDVGFDMLFTLVLSILWVEKLI